MGEWVGMTWLTVAVVIAVGCMIYTGYRDEETEGGEVFLWGLIAFCWPAFLASGVVAGIGWCVWKPFNLLGKSIRKAKGGE